MFFQKATTGFNEWWRYLLVTIAVGFGYMIGQFPLAMAITRTKTDNPNVTTDRLEEFSTNPNFEMFGINSNMGFALLLIMFVGALTAFYFIFKPMHNREFKTLVNPFSKIRWSRIFQAFFLWLAMTLILEVVTYFLYPENYTLHFKLNTFIPLLIISILILPIQTSTEELFFRGYIMQGTGLTQLYKLLSIIFSITIALILYAKISKSDYVNMLNEDSFSILFMKKLALIVVLTLFSLAIHDVILKVINNLKLPAEHFLMKRTKWMPLLISSALFGLVHVMNPEVEKFGIGIMQTYYITAGLVLGIMTIMDDGLELALGVHAATNFSGAVFVGYSGAAIQTDSILKTNDINPVLLLVFFVVMSICFLLYMKYKYQWGSFNKVFSPIEIQDDNNIIENYNTL